MLRNRVATLKSINIAQVIDIHIFTKVKSDINKICVNLDNLRYLRANRNEYEYGLVLSVLMAERVGWESNPPTN